MSSPKYRRFVWFRDLARAILPRKVHSAMRRSLGRFVFDFTIRGIRPNPSCLLKDRRVLDWLVYGWSSGWCVSAEYLWESLKVCENLPNSASVLECGSGLSTVVVALFLAEKSVKIITLEHDDKYARRVAQTLQRYNLANVSLVVAPLRDYGSFDWYNVEPSLLEQDFSFIMCDGPPGTTRGGRVGLLRLLGKRLPVGSTVILDDVNRPSEAALLEEWKRVRPCSVAVYSAGRRQFARITLR